MSDAADNGKHDAAGDEPETARATALFDADASAPADAPKPRAATKPKRPTTDAQRDAARMNGAANRNRAKTIRDIAEFFAENDSKTFDSVGITRVVPEPGAPMGALDDVLPGQLNLDYIRTRYGGGLFLLTPRYGGRFAGVQCELKLAGSAKNPHEPEPSRAAVEPSRVAAPVAAPVTSDVAALTFQVRFLERELDASRATIARKDDQIERLQQQLAEQSKQAAPALNPLDMLALLSGREDINDRQQERAQKRDEHEAQLRRQREAHDSELRTLRATVATLQQQLGAAHRLPSPPLSAPAAFSLGAAAAPAVDGLAQHEARVPGLSFFMTQATYDHLKTLDGAEYVAETDALGLDSAQYEEVTARINAEDNGADDGDDDDNETEDQE